MARTARVVIPGVAHHITQRGNRRQTVFFNNADYGAYFDLLSEWSSKENVSILTYCLMPNHVHLILVPSDESAFANAMREIHGRDTRYINFRQQWRGHLWQGRFASFPLSEQHLLHAIRYVEMNPVRARLALRPDQWDWSSAHNRLHAIPDAILDNGLLHKFGIDQQDFNLDVDIELFHRHEQNGLPLGGGTFIEHLEKLYNRKLSPQRPGPKPKNREVSVPGFPQIPPRKYRKKKHMSVREAASAQ